MVATDDFVISDGIDFPPIPGVTQIRHERVTNVVPPGCVLGASYQSVLPSGRY